MSKKSNLFTMARNWLRSSSWFNESMTPKVLFTLIVAVLTFIPAYLGILVWWLISPAGFWQVFATLALVLCVFGSTQFWFGILGGGCIVVVLASNEVPGMKLPRGEREYKYDEDKWSID